MASDFNATVDSPRDPFLPRSDAATRSRSPDAGGSEHKRRRKVLSCYDCRRRKLQCDRGVPACSRCTKAGQAANCLYLDDANDMPSRAVVDSAARGGTNSDLTGAAQDGSFGRPTHPPHSATSTGDYLSRLEFQDRRIKQLEAALTRVSPNPTIPSIMQLKASKLPLSPESIVGTSAAENSGSTATDRETMMLRGKSFKTQFFGLTHPGSLIAYIPELGNFTKEAFEKFSAFARIRQDIKALEDRTKYAGTKPQLVSDSDLKALLPSRPEADHLVQLYLENFDGIYHILHLPSFQREYSEMWNNIASARPHFIAIVLLVTAAAQCLTSPRPWLYTANSSTARERANLATRACEDWLQAQSEKHVTIADFQIRVLLLLAKQVSVWKWKRTWTYNGATLRFFMAAGLHRNPDLLRKPTSALDKEMRRKLWAAITELELQASFDRGMVSTPWPQQSDCPPPINIHDEDVSPSSQELPAPRPVQEFTSNLYISLASETIMLRHTLNSALNNIRQSISFDEAKRYTEQIEAHLQAMPQWIGRSTELPQALLSLNLRQYLLALHDRQIRQANSQAERTFSKMVIMETALKIMETQKSLTTKGCYAPEILWQNQLRAALSVCHVATTLDPQADGMLSQVVEQNADLVMKTAIELITDKIIRYGREQRQLWIVLAANGHMKAKRNPDQKLLYMQEAVDKITRPYYKIMACQEDAPTAVGSGPPTGREDLPNGTIEYLPITAESRTELQADVNDPPLLDIEELAAWTFDDWAFNPMDLQALEGDAFHT